MKADCGGNCTNCNETELPNIKDKNCQNIGYSYAYKTDCAGDRYIKAEEVKYLLKCERNKAIDDFARGLDYLLVKYAIENTLEPNINDVKFSLDHITKIISRVIEQLKAGGENEQSI